MLYDANRSPGGNVLGIKQLIFWLGLVFCGLVHAADCQKTGSVCADTTPSKVVSGVTVTLAQVGGCWSYQDTYRCIKPNAVDYCGGIASTPGCWLASTICSQTDFNGGCMTQTLTYRCGDPVTPLPPYTTYLNESYTTVKDTIDSSACSTTANNPNCTLASHTCSEPGGTRIINGLAVTKDCWAWTDSYTCTNIIDTDCGALAAKGCTLTNKACISKSATDGHCTDYEDTYSCPVGGGTTTTKDCSGKVACISDGAGGQSCFDSSAPTDTDFGTVIATTELAREAGVYENGLSIFSGADESCESKRYGIPTKCCRTSGGSKSNHDIMSGMVSQVLGNVGSYAWSQGSKYVYDFMYQSSIPWLQDRAIDAMTSVGSCFSDFSLAGGGFSPSFGAFGFSIATTAPGSLVGSYSQIATLYETASGTQVGLYFNPYVFAAQIAITVVMELLSCSDEEMLLGMHRGAGLCYHTDTECSGSILKTCTEHYCCYNSKLARIINEQGKPQLGMDRKNCNGFSTEDFAKLDFSKINLSEFIGEVMQNFEIPTESSLKDQANATIQQKLKDYYSNQ